MEKFISPSKFWSHFFIQLVSLVRYLFMWNLSSFFEPKFWQVSKFSTFHGLKQPSETSFPEHPGIFSGNKFDPLKFTTWFFLENLALLFSKWWSPTRMQHHFLSLALNSWIFIHSPIVEIGFSWKLRRKCWCFSDIQVFSLKNSNISQRFKFPFRYSPQIFLSMGNSESTASLNNSPRVGGSQSARSARAPLGRCNSSNSTKSRPQSISPTLNGRSNSVR